MWKSWRLTEGIGVAAEHAEAKYFLENGDLLFARSGNTVGKAYLHRSLQKQQSLFAGYMIRFRANGENALPEYLFLCTQLRFYQHWVAATQRATGQPNINAEEYRSLELPVPNLATQSRLVDEYKKAALTFEAAQKNASKLLEGIDDYLLAELGINLPSESENTITSRIFTAQRRELAGWRFDPYYFRDKFHALEHALDVGPYGAASLGQIYLSINNGIDCRDFILGGLPYAKVADVKPFAIDLAQTQTVPIQAVPDRGLVRQGDLLLTRKGTFGVAALVETDTKFAISSEVFRIEIDHTKVLGPYLVAMLNSSICQEQFDRQKIGAIMGSLTQVSLRRIRLPLPPLAKQKEIQVVIDRIRAEASSLRERANNELEDAKHEIEAMLLGREEK